MKPNDFSIVMDELGIDTEPLPEPGSVLLSPQDKKRRHYEHRNGQDEAVKSEHAE